jgi:hypothetical protein
MEEYVIKRRKKKYRITVARPSFFDALVKMHLEIFMAGSVFALAGHFVHRSVRS